MNFAYPDTYELGHPDFICSDALRHDFWKECIDQVYSEIQSPPKRKIFSNLSRGLTLQQEQPGKRVAFVKLFHLQNTRWFPKGPSGLWRYGRAQKGISHCEMSVLAHEKFRKLSPPRHSRFYLLFFGWVDQIKSNYRKNCWLFFFGRGLQVNTIGKSLIVPSLWIRGW